MGNARKGIGESVAKALRETLERTQGEHGAEGLTANPKIGVRGEGEVFGPDRPEIEIPSKASSTRGAAKAAPRQAAKRVRNLVSRSPCVRGVTPLPRAGVLSRAG